MLPRRPLLALPLLLPAMARAQSLPAIIHPSANPAVTARRAPNGAYMVDATINGATLPMVFDTGATAIVLRPDDAARAGFDPATLAFTAFADTANGRTRIAPITLATVSIGPITRRNVRAAVAQPGQLFQSLLGQTFLARLAGYRTEGDRLILED